MYKKYKFIFILLILFGIGLLSYLLIFFDIPLFVKSHFRVCMMEIQEHIENRVKLLKNKNNSNANLFIGLGYIEKDNKKAYFYLDNAIKIDPQNKGVYLGMSQYYYRTHNYIKALYYFEEMIKIGGDKSKQRCLDTYIEYVVLAMCQDQSLENNKKYLNLLDKLVKEKMGVLKGKRGKGGQVQ